MWASQTALIQPTHGQGYNILIDRMHLLFTKVHFPILTARPGRRSIYNSGELDKSKAHALVSRPVRGFRQLVKATYLTCMLEQPNIRAEWLRPTSSRARIHYEKSCVPFLSWWGNRQIPRPTETGNVVGTQIEAWFSIVD